VLVTVDIQPALDQQTGIGRYVRCLAEGLGAGRGHDRVRLFCFDFHRRGVPFETCGAEVKAVTWCPGRLARKAWQTLGRPTYDQFAGDADLFHFTNFVRPPLRRGRSVVSIYDASFLRHPEAAEPANLAYLNRHVRATATAADGILTISEFSKKEMVEQLEVDPAKVHVVYPGLDHARHAPSTEDIVLARAALGLTRPYLLMVSTVEPRKNMPFLVEVFDRLSAFDGDLVVAGMPGWQYEPILEAMRTARRAERIRYLEYVDEEHLAGLYAGAELFVFPSLYEGFGFPPLEAMRCGTPVVSSDGGSLAEALGEGAEVLSSFETDAWVECIHALLADEARRTNLAEKGRKQAGLYTWADHVAKTWSVYREVASA
jgi:glycosyltransferase involved in cell wall biosynthesis